MLACSWSGGKDCCHALWKTALEGKEVGYLLNTYRRESGRVAFHGVRAGLVRTQAESLGAELLQKEVFGDDYEGQFLEALHELKREGVTGVVFGDIDVLENRRWAEKVCHKARLDSLFPLWDLDQKAILGDFIESSFKAVIVAIDQKFLSKDDVGRELDRKWLHHITELNSRKGRELLTYCGENGEYHSFVYDGPNFKCPVRVAKGEKVLRDNHWLIDLLKV